MYSNGYIFRFAIILVVIVAAILSAAAVVLKPFQDKNIRTEKMQTILAAAEVDSDVATAEEFYKKYITKEVVLNMNGDVVSLYEDGKLVQGDDRAFDVELKEQIKTCRHIMREIRM